MERYVFCGMCREKITGEIARYDIRKELSNKGSVITLELCDYCAPIFDKELTKLIKISEAG